MTPPILGLLLLSILLQQPHQKAFTASAPCNNSLIMSIEGTYHKGNDSFGSGISSIWPTAQRPEGFRRLDAIHRLLVGAYPQPLGQEGEWFGTLTRFAFAPNAVEIAAQTYYCRFCYYTCMTNRGPNEVGYFCDNNARFSVYVNQLGEMAGGSFEGTIDGRPVRLLRPVIGSWKGYELHAGEGGESSTTRSVLLSRKGESPYIPVTRRQYLDHAPAAISASFDTQIQGLSEGPSFLSAASRDEAVKRLTRAKNDELKHYAEEFEKSKAANLLDSPAVVGGLYIVNAPVFYSAAEGGWLVVTANPAYIKKDRPAYVPQFIVMSWTWDVSASALDSGIQGLRYRRILEADFPIEKLQAMIDQ